MCFVTKKVKKGGNIMFKLLKKFGIIMLFLMIIFFLLGTAYSEETKKDYVIGWTVAYFDHPVYQLMMKAMQEEAEANNVKLIMVDGKNDPATQVAQVENFIAQKVDGIMITAAVADPMLPVIEKVNKNKIPLIIVDRRIFQRGRPVEWVCLVTWDMVGSGTYGGEQVVEALGGKGNLVVVEGTPGAGSTIDRGNAFYEVIDKYPDIKIVYKTEADFKRDKGLRVTEDILQRFPTKGDIDAIYYMNDEMALGGLQAIKASGRLGEFKIISVDGEKEALDALRRGEIDYEVMFHPDDHAVAIKIMLAVLKGEEITIDSLKEMDLTYKDRDMDIVESDGFPWVRPRCYKVDKTNAHLPEFQGW